MASPQLTEPGNLPPAPGFVDTTVRQIVRVTLAGTKLGLRLSNEFGTAPLTLTGIQVAPGTPMLSDALEFPVAALSDLAITLHLRTTATAITGHPGSRCTSYLQSGVALAAPELPSAVKVDTTGTFSQESRRWPDYLARRLQADRRNIAVLNAGIGGNCVIKGGLGPSALARFDRDVLAQPGVKWLVLFEGINDLKRELRAIQ